ncbi:heme uptake protein IsdC [Sutcliffiella halmapala]|uniref:heme uptake protein IsdC n=1 Tax=Sutcliffiella halmapala TaxID=79882 RepID=UPI0009956FDF|nr:heme uptake protein IsdC [Sutcliffiella halmapala]
MKKKLGTYLLLGVLLVSLFSLTITPSEAYGSTELADGTYTINYTVLHSDNDSASIANDYWEKPAKITVNNGKMTMQMTINHSSWVKEFKVANNGGFSDVSVISTDSAADKRVVQFPVSNLASPLVSKIHVTVADINYDHGYTIRFSFDTNSIKTVSLAGGTTNSSNENSSNATSSNGSNSSSDQQTSGNSSKTTTTENPETSDTAMISVFVLLLVVSGAFLVKRMKVQGE